MLNTKLTIAGALFLALAVGSAALGQREARKPPDVSGRVSAISADGKLLTVESGGGRGVDPTRTEVKLTDGTKTELVGPAKDLGRKLKVGDTVSVWLQGGSAESVQVNAAPDVAGKIASISGDSKTLTVEMPGEGRGEVKKVEIKITEKTKQVTRPTRGGEDDKPLTPQVGDSAAVWLQDGSKDMAAAVQITRPNPNAGGTRR
jgi:hypothetical protein